MGLGGQITALVAVGPHSDAGSKPVFGEEETDELQRNTVGECPAIFSTLCRDIKELLHLLGNYLHPPVASGAEAQMDAAIGVDLHVEIAVIFAGSEEELHTAVAAHRVQQARQRRTDVLFLRLHAHVEVFAVVAQLRLRRDMLSAMTDSIKRLLMMMAYNAGRGNTHGWMNANGWDYNFGETKAIPYPESRNYVASVLHDRDEYYRLYKDKVDSK